MRRFSVEVEKHLVSASALDQAFHHCLIRRATFGADHANSTESAQIVEFAVNLCNYFLEALLRRGRVFAEQTRSIDCLAALQFIKNYGQWRWVSRSNRLGSQVAGSCAQSQDKDMQE